MIEKTFEILKARWPEAALIVGLQTAMMLLQQEMGRQWGLTGQDAVNTPGWAQFVLGMGVIALIVGWQLLFMGFLKTAATEGTQQQEPLALLRAGRPYLWQGLGARLLLEAGVWLISAAMVYGYLMAAGQPDTAQLPGWFAEIAVSLGTLIFVKPFFLVPVFIVVLDLRLSESIWQMRQVRLRDIKPLLKAAGVGFAAVTALAVVLSFAPKTGFLFYAATGLSHFARTVNHLVLFTAAALWTAAAFLPERAAEAQKK